MTTKLKTRANDYVKKYISKWSNVSWNKISWLMFPAIKWANYSNICWRCIFRIAIISTPFESKCKESHKYFECWILLNLNIESYPFFAWRLLTDRGAVAEEYWKLRALEKKTKRKRKQKNYNNKKNQKNKIEGCHSRGLLTFLHCGGGEVLTAKSSSKINKKDKKTKRKQKR